MSAAARMEKTKKDIINRVREIRAVWDKAHPHHHNVHVLAKHWKTVASKVGRSDKECKVIWKNLRQEFVKQWKKHKRAEEAPPDEEIVCTWPYYAPMEFLTGQLEEPVTETLMVIKDENLTLDDYSDVTGDDSCTFQQPDEPCSPQSQESSATSVGHRSQKTAQNQIGDACISVEREKPNLKRKSPEQDQDDENILFLKSLAPQMRKLDSQRNMLFRTEMQGRLYDLLYNPSAV